jgi:TRAP-type C4-dicarboxylate transport system permease small subunit
MALLEGLKRVVHQLSRWFCIAGMWLVLPLVFLTVADVISRDFFNKPIPGVFELSEYMLCVIILLGAAYTQQVKGHVSVDFLTSRFPPKARRAIEVLTTLLSLFMVTLVVWQGFVVGLEETGVSDMLRIPKAPFMILVGAGGTLLWLELLIGLIESIARASGR